MITLPLTKSPRLASAFVFFQRKRRLVIEYILIAMIITTAGFIFSMWLSNGLTEKSLLITQSELQIIQHRLGEVESVNFQQQETIGELQELRLQDSRMLTGLMANYKALVDNDARNGLTASKKSNKTVLNYLERRIPLVSPAVDRGTVIDKRPY